MARFYPVKQSTYLGSGIWDRYAQYGCRNKYLKFSKALLKFLFVI